MTDNESVIVYSRPMSSLLFDSVTVSAGVLPQEQKLLFVLDLITRAKMIYFGLQHLDMSPLGSSTSELQAYALLLRVLTVWICD